jgi:hypothetical protein
MKAKTMATMMQSLSVPAGYVGEDFKDKKLVPLDKLATGSNTHSVAIVGVAAVVPSKDRVP